MGAARRGSTQSGVDYIYCGIRWRPRASPEITRTGALAQRWVCLQHPLGWAKAYVRGPLTYVSRASLIGRGMLCACYYGWMTVHTHPRVIGSSELTVSLDPQRWFPSPELTRGFPTERTTGLLCDD